MLDEVVRSRQALERNRDTLEQSVLSRTAELAAANATLRRGDDARRRFLAEVSHELRTPLTVIRGEAEIALRGTDQPVPIYKQALARIAEEAAGTARLVDDLLFVARSEAGEVRFAVQAVAMDSVVQRAAAAARTIGESRAVRVTEQLGRNGVVLGDADRLRRLVLILLDNAVRYSRPGGEVEVTLTATAEAVQLTVQDHGIGIALEDQERVFERFYRGPGAAQLHAGGSGLGLPLARAIARAHGGELTLDSRPGEGTTLRVMLPAARQLQAVA
jgi:signal transduction histidine kinase